MGNREELTLLFSDCYSIDGSVCKLHPVFQPQKAINKLFELGYRKPGELLSDIEKNLRMYFVSDDQGNIAVTKSWRILKAQLDKRGE